MNNIEVAYQEIKDVCDGIEITEEEAKLLLNELRNKGLILNN